MQQHRADGLLQQLRHKEEMQQHKEQMQRQEEELKRLRDEKDMQQHDHWCVRIPSVARGLARTRLLALCLLRFRRAGVRAGSLA